MMQKGNFDFGGEYSGHVYFRDKFPGFDDGIYAGLRMIEILANTGKPVSEHLKDINKYYSTEELKYKFIVKCQEHSTSTNSILILQNV